jgi:hypothetical protein
MSDKLHEAIVRAALERAAYGVTRADRDWTFEKAIIVKGEDT